MDAAPTYRVHVGAVGWEHPHWVGTFYPEDLPAEWRLAFYNQWFDCVLVPESRWIAATEEELIGWREDTLARFRFVLESSSASPQARARAACLGSKLGMWYPEGARAEGGPRLEWLTPDEDLKELAARIQTLTRESGELYLIGRRASAAYLNRVVTLLELLQL
jgi:uncharacterized protein YecE (DUF72 family)